MGSRREIEPTRSMLRIARLPPHYRRRTARPGPAFSAGIMLVFPTAYTMLGAGWLIMKTEGVLQRKSVAWARAALWPTGLTLVAISLATPLVSPTVFEKWFTLPELFALLPIPLACGAAFFSAWLALHRPRIVEAGYGWIVFAATVLIFLLAFLGLAYSIYPYVVLDQLTIWDAASATEALAVILIGVAITLPVIIIYTIFMYRVFWGKATTLSYGMTPKG
jgi:cytochrome d ubiquinol oxidase subunit II